MSQRKTVGLSALAFIAFALVSCQQPVNNQGRPETAAPTVEDDRATDSQVTDTTGVQADSTLHNHQ